MITKNRDASGRLRVPFFIKLIRQFCSGLLSYDADVFKKHVEGLEILTRADWECENNGYAKWKHRVDRAAQKVFTDV